MSSLNGKVSGLDVALPVQRVAPVITVLVPLDGENESMPTIRDVAKACGLSAMTVSAVLNNKAGEASAETRARVLCAVRELGYRPNAVARGLSRRSMNTLGVIMAYRGQPSLTGDRYNGPVLDGILDENRRQHKRTLVITENSWDEAAEHMPGYFDGHCDGLIFLIPEMPDETLIPYLNSKVPMILIGETRQEPQLSCIDIDNVAAAQQITDYLLQRGHRRIALLRGAMTLIASRQREEGYRRALQRWGLPETSVDVLDGQNLHESGCERAKAILQRPRSEWPTALFCSDDWIALGALQALTEAGVRVPEQMSLVGINDDPEATSAQPALTTMSQPLKQMGERAVRFLLEQRQGAIPSGTKLFLEATLIERDSVAVPSSS